MSDIASTSERLKLVPKNCSSYTTENKTNKTLKSLFWWWWSDCVYFRTNVRSEALLYDWKQNKTEIHISTSRSIISVPGYHRYYYYASSLKSSSGVVVVVVIIAAVAFGRLY